MHQEPQALGGLYLARVKAQKLSEEAFLEAERRYAGGLPFEAAKREVLEERVPAYVAEHGEAVADLVIQSVMNVRERGTHPGARRAHRNRRWKHLVAAHLAAGGTAPSRFERRLFDWFGVIPRRLLP